MRNEFGQIAEKYRNFREHQKELKLYGSYSAGLYVPAGILSKVGEEPIDPFLRGVLCSGSSISTMDRMSKGRGLLNDDERQEIRESIWQKSISGTYDIAMNESDTRVELNLDHPQASDYLQAHLPSTRVLLHGRYGRRARNVEAATSEFDEGKFIFSFPALPNGMKNAHLYIHTFPEADAVDTQYQRMNLWLGMVESTR